MDNIYEHIATFIGAVILVVLIVVFGIMVIQDGDEKTGSCRYEPGYMGQAEVVECYEP